MLQFFDTAKGPAPDGLLFEFGKPALDEIEPAGTGRNKMKHEAWSLTQPSANPLVTVDGIVVEDQVQAARGWKLAVEPAQEAQELLMAMTRIMLRDHSALADVERGKQAGRAVPFILVGEGSAAATLQRQARLRTVQRLNLALLIHTQHHGVLGWLQID